MGNLGLIDTSINPDLSATNACESKKFESFTSLTLHQLLTEVFKNSSGEANALVAKNYI
jgi:hypothetical protein